MWESVVDGSSPLSVLIVENCALGLCKPVKGQMITYNVWHEIALPAWEIIPLHRHCLVDRQC